jgi:AcrR family transcriptional regulator
MEPADREVVEANRRLAELVSTEAGAITGALAGMLLAGPPGALVGAGAGVMVQRVVNAAMARRFQRAVTAVEVAADEAGLSVEALYERLREKERLHELAAAVIAAAAETMLQAKIRALGQALARGTLATDDAEIDREQFLVDTLADLKAPHLQVLHQVSGRYDDYGDPTTPDGTPQAHGWSPDALRKAIPSLAPVLGPVLAILSGHDLIRNTAVGTLGYVPGPRDRWVLTEHGDDLLRLLRDRADEGDAAS